MNHSALLADITSDDKERTSLVQWSAVCATVGSLTSVVARIYWNPSDMLAFRRVSPGALNAALHLLWVADSQFCHLEGGDCGQHGMFGRF